MSTTIRYRLLDGEELNHAYPDTFEIPSAEARKDVRIGNWVKLGFMILSPTDNYDTERMWVAVAESSSDCYCGTLRNDPCHDVGAVLGDPIMFGPQHLLNIAEDEDDVDLQALLVCGVIVSRRIYADSAQPGWLRRGEPLDGRDSGWVVLAGDEDDAYTDDPDNLRVMRLVDLLDGAVPELAQVLLTADAGTEWEWNADIRQYERVSTDDEDPDEPHG